MWAPVPHPNPEQSFASKDQLEVSCLQIAAELSEQRRQGRRQNSAQLQPHTPAGLASTAVVTKRDIDTAAEGIHQRRFEKLRHGHSEQTKVAPNNSANLLRRGPAISIIDGMMRHVAQDTSRMQNENQQVTTSIR